MKSPRPTPFKFVLEQLESLNPITRPMFGCTAVYVGEKIVMILRLKNENEQDNGVWLATTPEYHQSLKQEFPEMRSIGMFGPKPSGWQVLPSDTGDFESSVMKACELILLGDKRIGKIPKQKKIKPPKGYRGSSFEGGSRLGSINRKTDVSSKTNYDTGALAELTLKLEGLADSEIERVSRRFFKTGPGEYGEGDNFRGIRVPVLRKLSKDYKNLSFSEIEKLLRSGFHEDRLIALLILVRQYAASDKTLRSKIYKLYLENTRFINNWDLVDSSAEHIVGAHLLERSRQPIYRLAKSKDLWERRIAIISTFFFIKRLEFEETLTVAGMLLTDKEDLIQKAVGWMLREVGNRDEKAMKAFLRTRYRQMPRVMLRYAIEKLPEVERHKYLKGEM